MNKKHFAYCAVGVLGLYLGAVAIVNQSDKNLAARNMAKYEHFDKETLDYQAASVLSNAAVDTVTLRTVKCHSTKTYPLQTD
ncbi:hypothetical protein JCM19235_5900 [Vibrio maritimus]|uniref:Uncharacterized protein n=1 Tax=Vibrio maritimus TaxID=990268 RepID=A0A090RPZ3_9VIBR|nr:hypothetical protein JCM19235_5900 [Vibrio maritimus]